MNQEKNARTLVFLVEEAMTDIALLQGGEEIGRVRVESNQELLEKLLLAIDGILARHALASSDIADIRVESELPDGYSSRRIAETVANIFLFSRKEIDKNKFQM